MAINKITVTLADSSTLELGAATVVNLPQVRDLLLKISSKWILEAFDLMDVMQDEETRDNLQKLVNLLPRIGGANGQTGFDISLIQNDYPQIESLFFGENISLKDSPTGTELDTSNFVGSKILQLHGGNPLKKLIQAQEITLSLELSSQEDPLQSQSQ